MEIEHGSTDLAGADVLGGASQHIPVTTVGLLGEKREGRVPFGPRPSPSRSFPGAHRRVRGLDSESAPVPVAVTELDSGSSSALGV